MQTQEFQTISNQIAVLTSSLKDSIKQMSSANSKLENESKLKNDPSFHSLIEDASNLFSAPVDFRPLITQKYKKQQDQITKLLNQLTRFVNDIEAHSKKFEENVEEEKRKFNRSINNLANNYYDQREMHTSNHEAQISNLEDAIYELKANYEAKLSDGLKKVAAEKQLLKKLYKTVQKNYNDLKPGLESNLPETNSQVYTDNEDNEKDLNKNKNDINDNDNNNYNDDNDNDNNNYNDATGSSEVKTRAYMGDILNKIDEIEEVEQENKKLADQIQAMKLKNETEIAQLKNQLTQIETNTESKLNGALKANQEKYDNDFEAIKSKYAQIESELIKKLNALKKEQSATNNNLKTELSKVKAMSNSCKVKISKKIKEAEIISESKINQKKLELQNLKAEHSKAVEEFLKENKSEAGQIYPENAFNSSSSTNSRPSSSIRRKLSQSKKKVSQPQTPQPANLPRRPMQSNKEDDKIDSSDTKSLMEKINESENESMQKIAQYSELKNNLRIKIAEEDAATSNQLSEIEKETEIAQSELNDLLKNLEELQQSLSASMSITNSSNEIEKQQKDEINSKKDEINRRRVAVNKRKALQAVQSLHHQEIDKIDEDIQNIIFNSVSQIQQKSENLLDEQKKTNETLTESSTKLEAVLKELKEIKIDEEEVAIKERQKWGEIRSSIANSTIDLYNQSKNKNTSRPTSSQSRPIVSSSKLPPLQKSQS